MLIGERVKLIPVKKEYVDSYIKWINDPEITQYLVRFRPITREMEEDWYNNLINRENDFLFAIVIPQEKEEEKLIGNCGIHQVNWKDRIGIIGIMIGEKEYWGKGFGTEAMELLLRYGFDTLNLNRLELLVYDYNKRAIKCYNNLGFVKEGVKRQAIFIKGKYHNIIMMSILYQEWESNLK